MRPRSRRRRVGVALVLCSFPVVLVGVAGCSAFLGLENFAVGFEGGTDATRTIADTSDAASDADADGTTDADAAADADAQTDGDAA